MKAGLMLGVNPNAEREKNDFYATNPHAIEIAMPYFKELGLNKNVWECACGEGHIAEVFKNHGYYVLATDLIDRGYGETQDFLLSQGKYNCDIVTNPPFKFAEDFVKRGFELIDNGNRVCLFLKIQFLESKTRKELFEKYPLKELWVYSERQQCSKNADFEKYKATTQCYAWFIFEKGYVGNPIIKWI